MATHDYVIDNQTTPAFRSDLNNALSAIVSNNSSTTAPSTTYAGMWWLDTTNNYLKIRDKNDANWITIGEFDISNSRFELISNVITAASAAGIDIFNSSGTKIIDLQVASQATAEAGTNNTELMTPLRVSQSIAANVVPYPQVITTLTSGSSYVIPSDAQAILIRASGGGGGGAVHANPGTGGLGNNSYTQGVAGGATTVSNATLGISINAPGGSRGSVGGSMTTSQWHTNQGTPSGGDVFWNSGASGGRTTGNNFDNSQEDGGAGCVVQKYVTGSSVGGETLTYSIGAGGNSTDLGGSIQPEDGRDGYIELTIW